MAGKMKSKSKAKAPRKGAKKVVRRRAVARRRANVSDLASCSVRRSLAPATGNHMYSFDDIALAQFDRASAIAKNYQRFRITGVKVTWKPTFDTYSPATPNQKPYLYYMVDKSGSIPDNVTLEGLKQMGARPRALDEKPVSVTFKPAVLGESRINAGIPQASQYLVSPWLATAQNPTSPLAWNPSDVSHQGLKFYIEQFGVAEQVFQMEIEVQFQFIKPLFPTLSSTPALGLQYAVLDNSSDGIVGGADTLVGSPSLA